jgi:F-type H+-transporting ATPase subunit epsilon
MATTDAQLTLEVATPTGLMLSTTAASVQAPSVEGEFGVLPGHLPLLAALKFGVLSYVAGGERKFAAVGSGFVEAGPRSVLLLTNHFAPRESLNEASIRDEVQKAEEALRAFDGDLETREGRELLQAAEWARARLETALAH